MTNTTSAAPALISERDDYGRSITMTADRKRCMFRSPATGEWIVNMNRFTGQGPKRVEIVATRKEALALILQP